MNFKNVLSFLSILICLSCKIDHTGVDEVLKFDSPFEYLRKKSVHSIFINNDEFWFVSLTESKITLPPSASYRLYDMQLSIQKNSTFDYRDLALDHINLIAFDKNGKMFGTAGSSLLIIEDLHTFSSYYTHNEPISTIAFDKNNKIWIGCHKGGLSVWDGSRWENYNILNSTLPTNEILKISIDKNNVVWVSLGADYSGLLRIEGDEWQYFKCSDLINDEYYNFYNLVLDKENNLWLRYKGKFYIYNGVDWSTIELDVNQADGKEIFSILKSDIFGNIWAVYMNSYYPREEVLSDIYLYDSNKWKKQVENFKGKIYDLELDVDNQLWIGKFNGLSTKKLSDSITN